MKRIVFMSLLSLLAFAKASAASSPVPIPVKVYGYIGKYYPVVFSDVNWSKGRTSIAIYRPNVHTDSLWRGSLVAEITFHPTQCRHGSNFSHLDLRQRNSFVCDFKDMTIPNGSNHFVIWLKGGGTTYYYHGINCDPTAPIVYDDNQNALPLLLTNGGTYIWILAPASELNQNEIIDTSHRTRNKLH